MTFKTLHELEDYEIDEIVIPMGMVFVGIIIDLSRFKKNKRLELEKYRIFTSMLSATNHILNNYLTRMQLFKLEALRSEDFDKELLHHYDQVIEETKQQLENLGQLTKITEKEINNSVRPENHGDRSGRENQ